MIKRFLAWFRDAELRQTYEIGEPVRFRWPWSRTMSLREARKVWRVLP